MDGRSSGHGRRDMVERINNPNKEFYLGRKRLKPGPVKPSTDVETSQEVEEVEPPAYQKPKKVTVQLCDSPKIDIEVPEQLEAEAMKYENCLQIKKAIKNSNRYSFFYSKEEKMSTDITGTTFETDDFMLTDGRKFDFEDSELIITLEKIEDRKFKEYRVLQKTGDTAWKSVPVQVQNSKIRFECGDFDGFVVVQQPKQETMKVTNQGATYKNKTDERIRVDFPRGAVDKDRNLHFKVIPVSADTSSEEDLPVLSSTLYIHQDANEDFAVPVQVHLPLDDFGDFDRSKYKLEMLRWTKDDFDVVPTKIKVEKDMATFDCQCFSGVSVVKTRDIPQSLDALKIGVLLERGDVTKCRVLSFVSPFLFEKDKSMGIHCECVDAKNVKKVLTERHSNELFEIPNSSSKDFFLCDGDVIHISVQGSKKLLPQQVHSANVVFLRTSDTNYQVIYLTNNASMKNEAAVIISYKVTTRCNLHFEWTVRFLPESVMSRIKNPLREKPKYLDFQKDRNTTESKQRVEPNASKYRGQKVRDEQKVSYVKGGVAMPKDMRKAEEVKGKKAKGIPQRKPNDEQKHLARREADRSDEVIPVDTTAEDQSKEEEQVSSDCISEEALQANPLFSDKSMSCLSREIPQKDFLHFGIHLGLSLDVTSSIAKGTTIENSVLKILVYWNKERTGADNEKCRVLTNALLETGLKSAARAVQEAFVEQRELRRNDFKF